TSGVRNDECVGEGRMREMSTFGLMSGMWKRSMVGLVRHPQTKGRVTDRPDLNHRATSRLYETPTYPTRRSQFGRSGRSAQRQKPNCWRRVDPPRAADVGLRAESI